MSGGEIILILLFVLIFFGADKIPGIARGLGKGLQEFKRAADEIKAEITSDTAEIRNELSEIRTELTRNTSEVRQEVNEIRTEIQQTSSEINKETHQSVDKSYEVYDELKENREVESEAPKKSEANTGDFYKGANI